MPLTPGLCLPLPEQVLDLHLVPCDKPGTSLLGIGGFRLLPGPEMGSAEAGRPGTSLGSLAGAGLKGVCFGAQRQPWWLWSGLRDSLRVKPHSSAVPMWWPLSMLLVLGTPQPSPQSSSCPCMCSQPLSLTQPLKGHEEPFRHWCLATITVTDPTAPQVTMSFSSWQELPAGQCPDGWSSGPSPAPVSLSPVTRLLYQVRLCSRPFLYEGGGSPELKTVAGPGKQKSPQAITQGENVT